MTRVLLLLTCAAALAACGDDGATPDAGRADAGPAGLDAGPGGRDAGPGLDAGPGPDDAGPGPEDAGPPSDGGDAGPVSMPCTAAGDCDPFDPDSCGAGMACRTTGDAGTTFCGDVSDPPRGPGEECRTAADCSGGLRCLDFGDGFQCMRLCPDGSIGACPDGEGCFGNVGDECVRVCRPLPSRCDIYAQDCADPDDGCTLVSHPETGERYTGCRPSGEGARGEACGSGMGGCGRGLICVREDGVSTCRQVCGPEGREPTCEDEAEACTGRTRGWDVSYCRAAA